MRSEFGGVEDAPPLRPREKLLLSEKRFLEMVVSGHSMQEILDDLCRLVEDLAAGSHCSVVLVGSSGSHLEHGAAPSLPDGFIASIIGRPVSTESGPSAMAVCLNEQVISTDLATETRWRSSEWCSMAMTYGLRSCWSTPIPSTAGRPSGAFAVYYDEPRTPTTQERDVIEQLTHLAGIAIQREQDKVALTRALDAITTSEIRLRTIIDTIPISVWSAGASGRTDFWNKRWQDYAGFTPGSSDDDWSRVVHPDDLAKLWMEVERSVASGQPSQLESRFRQADGQYRWFQSRWEPLRDEQGSIIRWYGANTDIDDRKQAENLLAGQNRLLEMVASGVPLQAVLDELCELIEQATEDCYCGILFADPSGAKWKQAAGPALPKGYNAAMTGRPAHADSGPCGRAACSQSEVFVTDVVEDTRWQAHGWSNLALGHGLRSCWSSPILSRDRVTLGVLALYRKKPGEPSPFQVELIRQLTQIASIAVERANNDASLRRSEACLVEAQKLSLTGSFGWSVATDIHFWSDETFSIFEYDRSTPIVLRLVLDRAHPEDTHIVERAVEMALAGNAIDYECRFVMPGGKLKVLHIVAHSTRDEDGFIDYIGAVQDVTALRLSEEVLGKLRSELTYMARVTSLGALTASIAHEVNQPLSGIINNSNTCLRMLAADPPNVKGALETARRNIRDGNRASDVISRLRALFGKNGRTTESVDLNEAAREVIALSLTEMKRAKVVLRPEFAEDLPAISGDRIQLQQVILNLVMNASEAMTGVVGRPRRMVIRTLYDAGERVQLTVEDAGVGLDSNGTERIFDPFYTTKETGMGIGLAVSRSIIESHQGRLWAAPNDGPGATFAFSIPRAGQVPPSSDLRPAQAEGVA